MGSLYATLIDLLFFIPYTVILLRIAFPLVRAPFSDPVVGWVYTVTTPVLRPLERYIPRWRNLSLAAVVLLWLVASLEFALLSLVLAPLAWLIGGFGLAANFAIGFLIVMIVLYTLFSLFEPRTGSSVVFLTHRIAAPLCGLYRRLVPTIGPFDLSPMLVILTLLILRILVAMLVQTLLRAVLSMG